MCSGWYIFHKSDDLFLCSDEWLDVGLFLICGAPYCYCSDEVWVDVGVAEFFHYVGG